MVLRRSAVTAVISGSQINLIA